jgi:hypothetical protein
MTMTGRRGSHLAYTSADGDTRAAVNPLNLLSIADDLESCARAGRYLGSQGT